MTRHPTDHSASAATGSASSEALALKLQGVSKTFPGVRALVDMDFAVRAGSVHALLGHNGCGKSTLIKCLAGVHAPDPGASAEVFGQALELGNAVEAEQRGVRFVHQDLGVIPQFGATDNVGLVTGYRRNRWGFIDWKAQERQASDLLQRFGFDLDPHQPLALASPPERTAVGIVRAIADLPEAKGVLILDEPTAALPAHEVDRLFQLIRNISATGAAVVLVSHRLDEVIAIADHATVMRDGRPVWDGALADVSLGRLIDLVAGTHTRRKGVEGEVVASALITGAIEPAPVVLEVKGVSGRYLAGVDLTVRSGEIVGVAGLLGSGREELPYVVTGAAGLGVTGSFTLSGTTYKALNVPRAMRHGVVFVPPDRSSESVFDGFTTAENVSLAGLDAVASNGVLAPGAERRFSMRWLSALQANLDYAPRAVTTLSGGNQQKAVLARALSTEPRVMVVSEPTAGIDIGARQGIYDELKARAADGLAIVMASSDLEDLLACCDRVIALRDGRVAGEFSGEQLTKNAISYAVEGAHDGSQ